MRYVVMLMLGTMLVGCKPGARDNARDLAQATVGKYAFEAYPMWTIIHPGLMCPATIGDLAPHAETASTTDPWGNEYFMFCGDALPAGAKVFAVQSAGPDGKRDTADDIKSWE
jgi:hypothetical protein